MLIANIFHIQCHCSQSRLIAKVLTANKCFQQPLHRVYWLTFRTTNDLCLHKYIITAFQSGLQPNFLHQLCCVWNPQFIYLFVNYNKLTNYIRIIYELSNFDHVLGVVSQTRVSVGNRTQDPHANSLAHYPRDYHGTHSQF